jgi:hypothetical protein
MAARPPFPLTEKDDDMADAIFAALLGVLIATACIGIPQLVRIRTQRSDDDTKAYLTETGRSARDIAESNAEVRERQQHEDTAERASGS